MLLPAKPIRYRKSSRRRKYSATTPQTLTLVSAEYSPGSSIRLTFNKAIDISAIDVAAITVKDGPLVGMNYQGYDVATLFGINAVDVPLQETTAYSGTDVLLTATSANGIVAADDEETWTGVSDYVVPA